MKGKLKIWFLRQMLKRKAKGKVGTPYVNGERYFEYDIVLRWLDSNKSFMNILDIGSQDSMLPILLTFTGKKVVCVDPSNDVIQQNIFAEIMGLKNDIHAVLAYGQLLPFRENYFDAVTCISTLDHIPDDGDSLTLRETMRVLRPGGILIMSFPWQKYYYEYWGTEPLYNNLCQDKLKLIARHYDQTHLEKRILFQSEFMIKEMLIGESPRNESLVVKLLRHSPLPGLADIMRGSSYKICAKGSETLHRRYTAVIQVVKLSND